MRPDVVKTSKQKSSNYILFFDYLDKVHITVCNYQQNSVGACRWKASEAMISQIQSYLLGFNNYFSLIGFQ